MKITFKKKPDEKGKREMLEILLKILNDKKIKINNCKLEIGCKTDKLICQDTKKILSIIPINDYSLILKLNYKYKNGKQNNI